MVVENVYVILNSDDELKSIFEEDELNDFFNEYTYDLIEEVEKNYSIEEQIEIYLPILNSLIKYCNSTEIKGFKESDIKAYIEDYNSIAYQELKYKKLKIEQDEMGIVTEFIFRHGLENYLESTLLEDSVIAYAITDSQENTLYFESIEQLKFIVSSLIVSSCDKLVQRSDSCFLLFDESNYLKELINLYHEYKISINTNEDFLKRVISCLNLHSEYKDNNLSFQKLIINKAQFDEIRKLELSKKAS